MSKLVKPFIALFVILIVTLPALLLVALVVGVAILLSGAALSSVGLVVTVTAGAVATVVGLLAVLLACVWCAHFHHVDLVCRVAGQCQHLPLTIDLRGRTICAHLWLKARVLRRLGHTWPDAIEQALETYLTDDLRDYLLEAARAQHGVAVADAMDWADEQAYHVSL